MTTGIGFDPIMGSAASIADMMGSGGGFGAMVPSVIQNMSPPVGMAAAPIAAAASPTAAKAEGETNSNGFMDWVRNFGNMAVSPTGQQALQGGAAALLGDESPMGRLAGTYAGYNQQRMLYAELIKALDTDATDTGEGQGTTSSLGTLISGLMGGGMPDATPPTQERVDNGVINTPARSSQVVPSFAGWGMAPGDIATANAISQKNRMLPFEQARSEAIANQQNAQAWRIMNPTKKEVPTKWTEWEVENEDGSTERFTAPEGKPDEKARMSISRPKEERNPFDFDSSKSIVDEKTGKTVEMGFYSRTNPKTGELETISRPMGEKPITVKDESGKALKEEQALLDIEESKVDIANKTVQDALTYLEAKNTSLRKMIDPVDQQASELAYAADVERYKKLGLEPRLREEFTQSLIDKRIFYEKEEQAIISGERTYFNLHPEDGGPPITGSPFTSRDIPIDTTKSIPTVFDSPESLLDLIEKNRE